MGKPFGGGLSSDKIQLLYTQLTGVEWALAKLTQELLFEENESSQLDPDKLLKGSPRCAAITDARQAVHDAIGDFGAQPGIAVKLANLVVDLNTFQQRVSDLRASFAQVLCDPGEAPDC